jgi:type I restriction enzyme R subunit
LAIYGDSDSKGVAAGDDDAPVKPLEELVEELEEAVKTTEIFLVDECKFSLSKIIAAESTLHKIKYIQEGYNAICNTDETKAKFGVLARELFKKYKALMPDQSIYKFQPQRDAINALYTMINAKIEEADITHIVKQVQDVVNKSIETLNLELEKIEGYGEKIDISSLDFKKIEEEFLKVKENQNVAVQSLKDKVAKKLNKLLDQNPLRVDFYERYQEIIDDYNRGKEYRTIKEIFDELVVLLGDLSEESTRAKRENLAEDELTVFDMLTSDKKITDKEKAEVKEAARVLLKRLKNNEFNVVHWSEKTQTASAVRKVIEDYLFEKLPSPSYDEDISTKADILFNDFKTRYADFGELAA